MYSLGLGLFKHRGSVEDARIRLFTLIDDLKAASLLLDGDMDGFVKMHDVVRYTAISIASREQHAFISSTELKECPDKDCTRISLPYNDIGELPEGFECPKAELLFLMTEDPSLKIPDVFFEGISKLKVVDFTGVHFVSMPSSLSFLTNLQALCLHRGQLDNVTAIGELKQLEVLSFADSYIEELPRQIEQLTHLKLLDLSNCSKLEIIPANVLSKLTLLEALHLSNSFVEWGEEGNASLGELEQFSGLTTLEMQVLNANMLPKSLFCNFYGLKNYRIVIGDVWDWKVNNESSRTLKLRFNTSIHLELGIKMLLKETEDLYLDEVRGIENVLYDLDGDGFPQLKHLHVQNDPLIRHIVMNSTKQSTCVAFPILQSLFLDNLMTLEDICHGQPVADSFSKLKVLDVRNCERLTSLFPFSASEKEDVNNVGVVELTKIHSLTLENLPLLKSVCYEKKSDLPASEEPASSEGDPGATFSLFNRLVSLPNLEDLQISSICCEKIWQDNLSSTSSNLTSLIIKECNKLKHVFTTSMVKNISLLKQLEIRGCRSVEEIIHTEESVQQEEATPKIFFPKLDKLMLCSLPNLIRFCTAWYPVEFQSLRELEIDSCNSLTTFIPFAAHTDTMVSAEDEQVNSEDEQVNSKDEHVNSEDEKVNSEDEQVNSEDEKVKSEDEQVNNMNKFEIQSLFNGMVGFGNLEEMRLVSLDKVENMWHSHLAPDSFCKLKALHVESCPKLLIVFPWNVLPRFQRLEKLNLQRCFSVQEIFKFQELNVGEINGWLAFQLRELKLWNLAELKFIWSKEPPAGFTFRELKSIDVDQCTALKNICPRSIARDLSQLQFVSISKCEEVEEIVTKTEGVQSDFDTFKFPQLTSLYLDSLPKIKSFYPRRHRAEWRNLKRLDVINCNTNYKRAEVGGQGQGQHNIPFFFLEKVNVSTLEELTLHHNDLMVLQHIQFNTECFSKLKVVKLQSLSKESCLFLFGFLKTLYKFGVDESSLEELFSDERIVGKKVDLGRLEHLEISQAHNLKRIWKQDVPFNPFIQYLSTLKINWCGRLENIVQSSSFKNLTALEVNHCENLKYLVTVSTANGLLQLVKLSIFSCKMMTEVVQNDGDQTEDEILFSKLKVLNLEDLSQLTSFCSGNRAFSFPVLEDVTVSCCSEMSTFSYGELSTPKLRSIRMDKLLDEQYWEGDLNTTIGSLSMEAVYKDFQLSKYPALRTKWHDKDLGRCFHNVRTLAVDECEFFSKAISPYLLQSLNKLRKLEIRDCASVEEVFDLEGMSTNKRHRGLLPRLSELHLVNLPMLRHLWNKDPYRISDIKNLKLLKFHNCSSLKYAFTQSMAVCLVQLQELELTSCHMLEVIIKMDDEAEEELADDSITFPRLSKLLLIDLPAFTHLWN